MTRSTRRPMSSSPADASVQTWVLILSGFLVFKFGSMAVTAEDAHLWHWGLAVVGGVVGWCVSIIIQRLRSKGGGRK
jgi:hypothetical protein